MSPLVVDVTGNDLTYRVIGAAMTVQNQISSGFKEEVYEKALEVDWRSRCSDSTLSPLSMGANRSHSFTWICSWQIKSW